MKVERHALKLATVESQHIAEEAYDTLCFIHVKEQAALGATLKVKQMTLCSIADMRPSNNLASYHPHSICGNWVSCSGQTLRHQVK
jgi:hypothetical protein